ncbi:tetratricopeptide repeat protein [Actinoplanes sp. NPDC024001]|uniref:tetratricopeptide repeat protein n=1 Tax=Actinoplanes sp. NPDC024001 TaxID=3154598 RepID=UPI00340BDCC8
MGQEQAGTPAGAQQRTGAPADGDAPYMDEDGTWHNLRPIARLATSGPDPEPRRYSDTALGSGWFVTKTPAKAATTTQPEPAQQEPKAAAEGRPTPQQETPQKPQQESPQRDPQAENPQQAQQGPQQEGPQRAQQGPPQEGQQQAQQGPPHEDQQQAQQGPPQEGQQQGPQLAPHLPLTAADLSAIRWRLDGASLREVVDNRDALRELGERLDGPLADEADNIVKAGLLSVRAEVYRLLGELGMAAAASRLALAHAESAQDLQSMVIAQAELAHVLRLRGDYLEADRLFQRAVDADVPAAVRSVVHENAGRSCYDQGRHMEALDHFARAIRLGDPEDTDLVERIGVCLESVYIHVLRDGWGPYPRRVPEILGLLSERATDDGEPNALTEATAEHPVVVPADPQ